MNVGILASGYRPPAMPYGLPGRPAVVPVPYGAAFDTDAASYIAAVEAADGRPLEPTVAAAINSLVVGCKADGVWGAIKACCILMGARTLAGALTPLVGAAPTNNNFVGNDYDRKTGLIGNGTTKSLDSGQDNTAFQQNSFHLSVYVTSFLSGASVTGSDYLIGDRFETGFSGIAQSSTNVTFACRASAGTRSVGGSSPPSGFWGVSRASSSQYTSRFDGTTTTTSQASQAVTQRRLRVLASSSGTNGAANEFGTQRVAFYSIGDSLTLSLLDSRVTALYTAIGAAIP